MIPRFRHLLIPLDFTPRNQAALEVGFEISVREPAAVTLLHVIETIHPQAEPPDDELKEFYRRLEVRAFSELDSRAQRFGDAGVQVFQRVRFGPRTSQIVEYAAGHDIDLIIMNSHSLDRIHPATSMATVSYQVSVLCTCPILLVK